MPQDNYVGNLHIPKDEIPPGMTYRWMRVSVNNEPDNGNWQRKMRGGWKPVPRSRHPEYFPIMNIPGFKNDQYNEVILEGGLLLVEKPTKDVEQSQRRLQEEAIEVMEAVDWENHGDKDTPRFNESSNVQIERTTAEFKE